MDSSGRWHGSEAEAIAADEKIRAAFGEKNSDMPTRPPFSVAIGERILIVKENGEQIYGTFDGAEKNRVTITPEDSDNPRPYLELAERVHLTRSSGENVPAQIWDNRAGKIILRTLPM